MTIRTILLSTLTGALLAAMPMAHADDDRHRHGYNKDRYETVGHPGHKRFERHGKHARKWAHEHRKHRKGKGREWRRHRHDVERYYEQRRREAWRNDRRRHDGHRHRSRHGDDEYLAVLFYLLGEL